MTAPVIYLDAAGERRELPPPDTRPERHLTLLADAAQSPGLFRARVADAVRDLVREPEAA